MEMISLGVSPIAFSALARSGTGTFCGRTVTGAFSSCALMVVLSIVAVVPAREKGSGWDT